VLLQQAGELVDRLNSYCESYYNSSQPQVSDAEYDAQLGLLQQVLGQLRAFSQQGREEAAVLEARSPLGRVVSSCCHIL
jgi:NAD-dependent DNA ligase